MAARQIPQYTESQLAREIARTSAKDWAIDFRTVDRDEYAAFLDYAIELRVEDNRRAVIRGANKADGAPSWDMNVVAGRHRRAERVA